MIPRIGAVVILTLSCVWLARSPDWEPAVAVAVAAFAYLAVEVSEQKVHKKDHARHDEVVSGLKNRLDALEGAQCATQEIVGDLKKKHDDERRQADEKMKSVLGKMKNFGA